MINNSKLRYVLVTPAHNEADYIEKTIKSVIKQTILPVKWIIVSDGSTDHTNDIVKKYLDHNPWLELLNLPERKVRNFAAKVEAFNAGYKKIKSLKYDLIGSVDADVSFPEDYFEYLLEKFSTDESLGVAGTHYTEGEFHSFNDSFINVHHVNGQIQIFRKNCYSDIGGYQPNKGGGIDWVAVTTARMKGWKTYSFDERTFHHHRTMGTADTSVLGARFHYGKKDYFLGGHPVWEIARGLFQMTKKPYVIGGFFMLAGYFVSSLKRIERSVSRELMTFYRKEQLSRLRSLVFEKFGINRSN
jgi:glycosyltransferase involved in cell wall biosynthesis